MIFFVLSVGLNLKLLRNQSSTENLHYVFVVGDHPESFNCSDIFADNTAGGFKSTSGSVF